MRLSQEMVEKYTEVSTINSESQEAVLGLWRGGQGYTAMAEARGASYLNMPADLWRSFQKYPDDFLRINGQLLQFLKNAINKGKVFVLETPFREAIKNPSSNLYKEILYLLEHCYKLISENGLNKLVPK